MLQHQLMQVCPSSGHTALHLCCHAVRKLLRKLQDALCSCLFGSCGSPVRNAHGPLPSLGCENMRAAGIQDDLIDCGLNSRFLCGSAAQAAGAACAAAVHGGAAAPAPVPPAASSAEAAAAAGGPTSATGKPRTVTYPQSGAPVILHKPT